MHFVAVLLKESVGFICQRSRTGPRDAFDCSRLPVRGLPIENEKRLNVPLSRFSLAKLLGRCSQPFS